jgi:hypothetical protein
MASRPNSKKVTGGWTKLYNKELWDLNSSSTLLGSSNQGEQNEWDMQLTWDRSRMHTVLGEKPDSKRLAGRQSRRW